MRHAPMSFGITCPKLGVSFAAITKDVTVTACARGVYTSATSGIFGLLHIGTGSDSAEGAVWHINRRIFDWPPIRIDDTCGEYEVVIRRGKVRDDDFYVEGLAGFKGEG